MNKVILLLSVVLLGCKTASEKNGMELFQISKTKLENVSVILSSEELISHFGEPNEVIKNCRFYPNKSDDNKTSFDCWYYDNPNIGFAKFQNFTYLSFIEFEESSIQLINPKIILSSNTQLKDIKKVFPVAYNERRINTKTFSYKYDWVKINTESNLNPNILANTVELIFEDDRLKYFEFTWKPKDNTNKSQ
ncbi:hypothetical protein [Hanstruepera neustonica]|uniref:hypothetical protein n=1 Tax=Hanstruepera neustonica TaxID=1445657 RepID=UPI000C9F5BAA|nr:hypothetical protein [Hanstruepera neustonica]